jgi:hypothetical protein
MKTSQAAALSIILALSHLAVNAQGTFQNLDFESAAVPNVTSAEVVFIPTTNGVPAWSAYTGTNSEPLIMYNGVSAGSAQISVIDQHTAFFSNNVIGGNFTVTLDAGERTAGIVPAAIAQTGLVPSAAKSISFSAAQVSFGQISDLELTFAGYPVLFSLAGTGPNFGVYVGDISQFAGTSGELRFTERPISSQFSTVALDDIQFSDVAIPEPAPVGLLICAAIIALGMSHRHFLLATTRHSSAR